MISCEPVMKRRASILIVASVTALGFVAIVHSIASAEPVSDDWRVYHDAEMGVSFPLPPGLTQSEESFDLTGNADNPGVTMRVLTFRNAEGLATVWVASARNPNDLPVEEWVDAYIPCLAAYQPDLPQPYTTPIAGELGWVCPVTQYAEPSATIHFNHNGTVFVLSGNVYGSSEDNFPPTISEVDFQRIVDGFSFDAAVGQLPDTGGSPGSGPSPEWWTTVTLGGLMMAAGILTLIPLRRRSN